MPQNAERLIVRAEIIDAETVSDASLAKAGLKKDKDLLYTSFKLCHANINSNRDEFEIADLESSYATIKLKPVNWEHDDDEIIGTVYDAEFIDAPDSEDDDTAYVRAFAVIYKYKFPERAEEMKQKHEKGKLFYSMEVWFESATCSECGANYTSPDNYCDHLKDRFHNQSVSRKLKGLTFGGVGVVKAPADKEANSLSIAKKKLLSRPDGSQSCFNCDVEEVSVMDVDLLSMVKEEKAKEIKNKALWIFNDTIYVLLNDDNLSNADKVNKFEELSTQLFNIYELKKDNETGGTKLMSDNVYKTFNTEEDFKNSVAQSDVVKDLQESFSALQGEMDTLKESLDTANADKDTAVTAFEDYKSKIEADTLISNRVAELTDSGVDAEKITDKFKVAISKLSDEEFDSLKETFAKKEVKENNEDGEGAEANAEDQEPLENTGEEAQASNFNLGDFLSKACSK